MRDRPRGQLLGSDPRMVPLLGESFALTCPTCQACPEALLPPPAEGGPVCPWRDNCGWHLLATPEFSPQIF